MWVVTPATLRKIADVAEKYNVAMVKVTSAQRIALLGIKEEEVDAIWAELGTLCYDRNEKLKWQRLPA